MQNKNKLLKTWKLLKKLWHSFVCERKVIVLANFEMCLGFKTISTKTKDNVQEYKKIFAPSHA